MERRFYIAVNDELPVHITESELKRRLEVILSFDRPMQLMDQNVDDAIDILVYGIEK